MMVSGILVSEEGNVEPHSFVSPETRKALAMGNQSYSAMYLRAPNIINITLPRHGGHRITSAAGAKSCGVRSGDNSTHFHSRETGRPENRRGFSFGLAFFCLPQVWHNTGVNTHLLV